MLEKIKWFFIKWVAFIYVSMTAVALLLPDSQTGEGSNGFLVLAIWIALIVLIVKRHPVIACIGGTLIVIGLRSVGAGAEGLEQLTNAIGTMIGAAVALFAVYGIFTGGSKKSSGNYVEQPYVPEPSRSNYRRERSSWDYGGYEEKDVPELESGSKEYYEYLNAAKSIYEDFCKCRTTEEQRYYIKRGQRLKTTMISKYSPDDESVRYICDTYLDLREWF